MINRRYLKYGFLVSDYFSKNCSIKFKEINENNSITKDDLSIFLWFRLSREIKELPTESDLEWVADEVFYSMIEVILDLKSFSVLRNNTLYFLTIEQCVKNKIPITNLQKYTEIFNSSERFLEKTLEFKNEKNT